MEDLVIIGSGPAGISTALYAARGGLSVSVITHGESALLKAPRIDNYYGAPQIDGKTLYNNGIRQAEKLGVTLIDDQVVDLAYGQNQDLLISGATMHLSARALVLACGATRALPKIEGLKQYEGKGISFCAICDAFFFKQKNVVVLGDGAFAKEEAAILSDVTSSVSILPLRADGVRPYVVQITGDGERANGVRLSDGSTHFADGIFIADGVAGATALANKLGVLCDTEGVVTDVDGLTNVPNVFAAGDCTHGVKQIATAVYQGMTVGLAAIKTLRTDKI